MNDIVVAALYHFADLPDFEDMKDSLQDTCVKHGVRGTILLASEGLNGTIAGRREGIDAVLSYLRSDDRLKDLEHKESFTDFVPFHRMKVRLKKEIVTMGVPGVDPTETVGTYVAPKDWNELISDPEVMVIDTRNDFEVDIGTFKGAKNPHTKTFREFPDYVDRELGDAKEKKIAMFCTGGIRCEKATSFLQKKGFRNVFHLQGGILKYLEEVPEDESLWEGECFVFDNRITVDHHLQKGSYAQCFACKHPLTPEDLASSEYERGVSCPYCWGKLTPAQISAARNREVQCKLAEERGTEHIGPTHERDKPLRRSENTAE